MEKVDCEFSATGVDLKILGFKGKNWRFKMDPLFDKIAENNCKVNVKSNSISISLCKAAHKKWSSLKYVKSMSKPLPEDSTGGVNAELMGLMKDLYQ